MRLAERLRLLLERPFRLIAAAIVLQWLTTLAVALRADNVDVGLVEALNVSVLGPLAIVCAHRVAAAAGGAALGGWTVLVWVAVPWLTPLLTLAKYDPILRDDVLPLAVGLTGEGGYAEGIMILVAVALLTLRNRPAAALAAGVLAGLVAVWLWRAPGGTLSFEALQANMAGLREYFWSQRLLQWLPLAGLLAVARRSIPLALLLGGWFGAYLAFRGARTDVGFENGELFRVMLPALPAYILLAAALPLLVPTLAKRLGPLARPVEAP